MMRVLSFYLSALFVLSSSLSIIAQADQSAAEPAHAGHADHSDHSHAEHQMPMADSVDADPERFNAFMDGLSDAQIAVVSVQGMVCDFCARGIEKTFKKDPTVLRIDVDLARGKVLIAYVLEQEINFDDIKTKITNNGQTAVDLSVLKV
ncbi:MAG: heavy-metal-associated domain-containing protein [Pseudomonadales bacterium]